MQHHFTSIIHHLSALSHLSYTEIFFALLVSGHAVPIPESLTLVMLGYLSSLGDFVVWKIFIIGILSTYVFDLMLFVVARGGGELAERLIKKVRSSRLHRWMDKEEKHLFLITFASHFVPGWRFANPIIAGVTEMPWKKFFMYSLVGCVVYAPLFIIIGYFFIGRI